MNDRLIRIGAAMDEVNAASTALDDLSCPRTLGQTVAYLGWSVLMYAQFGGYAEITTALARNAAAAARRLGSLEGNRLADALCALADAVEVV